jgi:hypothetical protein
MPPSSLKAGSRFGQHAIVQPERLLDIGWDRVEDMRLVVLELDRRRFAGQEARAPPYRHRDEERSAISTVFVCSSPPAME